jgi:hypothetical protein
MQARKQPKNQGGLGFVQVDASEETTQKSRWLEICASGGRGHVACLMFGYGSWATVFLAAQKNLTNNFFQFVTAKIILFNLQPPK